MRFGALTVALSLWTAARAEGGILSAHTAMRCNISGDHGPDCDALRPSRLEGRFGILLGLDAAFNYRSPENSFTIYEGSGSRTTSSSNAKTTKLIKLGRSSGLKLGPTLRIHLLDRLGLALDAGFEGSVLGTESDDEQVSTAAQTSFALSYGGSYVGASVFLPVQKLDNMGFFLSTRRLLVKEGDVTLRLPFGNESTFKATPLTPIKEMSLGVFLSIIYFSYTVREESWQVTPTSTETFSSIKSRSSGIELGLSGPIWNLFP